MLKIVDARVSVLPNAESYKKEHLIHFIALVGEVVKRKYGASWDMKLASDGVTWNPYMKIKEHQVQFFTYLYEDIHLKERAAEPFLEEVYETVSDIVRFNLD